MNGRGAKQAGQHAAKALRCWADPPDWVLALAAEADRTSLAAVGQRVGRSAGALSQVIAASYPGDVEAVGRDCRAVLMAQTITCPVLGDIETGECHSHQRQPFSVASPVQVRLARTCPSCPHNGGER